MPLDNVSETADSDLPYRFENLEEKVKDVLAFGKPLGVRFKVSLNFNDRFSIQATALPLTSIEPHIIFTSKSLSQVRYRPFIKDTIKSFAGWPQPPSQIPSNSFLVQAKLDFGRVLHVDYMKRYTNTLFWLYGYGNVLDRGSAGLSGKVRYHAPNYNVGATVHTDNQVVCLSGLYRFSPPLCAGAELMYTFAEKNPGFTVGGQYTAKKFEVTAVVNHLLAFASSVTVDILPSVLTAGARYTFNGLSTESSGKVGFAYTPRSTPGLCVRVGAKSSKEVGVGVSYTTKRWGQSEITALAGVQYNYGSKEAGCGLSIGVGR